MANKVQFNKWDIVFSPKFPETICCKNPKCKKFFSIVKHHCDFCNTENHVSNIVSKARPVIIWIDQSRWYQSMAFAIPLSASSLLNDSFNHIILLEHYTFEHKDTTYNKPMRAIIHQATRIDGNVLSQDKFIGRITDKFLQNTIENKLLEWLFGNPVKS